MVGATVYFLLATLAGRAHHFHRREAPMEMVPERR
jgi:hypothetical protein